jgi:hypothetical protein
LKDAKQDQANAASKQDSRKGSEVNLGLQRDEIKVPKTIPNVKRLIPRPLRVTWNANAVRAKQMPMVIPNAMRTTSVS